MSNATSETESGAGPDNMMSALFASMVTQNSKMAWIFLGQAPNPTAKLPPRGALLRVTRLDPAAASTRAAGPAVLDETLSATIVPKSTQNLEALWGPATFLLLFSDTGSVGAPLLVNSSGIDAVDDDWRNWLDDNFRRHPLPPGTYQAVVGP